ncbi:MAG: M20/M25/M40 family metallo-hydrolase [Blastocatellia bacterium]
MNAITRSALAIVLLAALLAPQAIAQQPTADTQQAAARLAGSILVGGHGMKYLEDLTDKFGGRLTGSPAYNRSAEWAAAQFRAAGIKNVKLESFTIPNGWERGYARGRMTAPVERHLFIESLGWAPSTPAGGVRGDLVKVSDIDQDKIKAQADRLKGHIAILDLAAIFAHGLAGFGKIPAAFQAFKEAGAVAVVVGDFENNNVLNAFSFDWGAHTNPLPVAQIGMEDARLIDRLLASGAVTIEFEYQNKVSGPTEVNNVIAEIPGRDNGAEWLIIGAHLDSWDYGTGAQDNGSGAAMVLEAARAIVAMPQPPRRTIRFALWGGEEQGLLGSAAYVRAHQAEMARCVAVLNTDNGAGHPKGWKVEGRKDVEDAMRDISKALLADLSGGGLSEEASFDTDHGHFMLEGVPALDLWVEMEGYGKIHHKASDTIDKVNAHSLALGTAIVAVTAYAIAEREQRLAPRLEHAAVGNLVKKTNLEGFLKAIGVWN